MTHPLMEYTDTLPFNYGYTHSGVRITEYGDYRVRLECVLNDGSVPQGQGWVTGPRIKHIFREVGLGENSVGVSTYC
jgi:hypothetical protein